MATYTLISSNVLTSSAASVTFSSIPATYTDLVLRTSIRVSNATTRTYCQLKLNSITTNYSETFLIGYDSTAASGNYPSGTFAFFVNEYIDGDSATANTFSSGEVYIPNYAGSTNKPISLYSVAEGNAATGYGQYVKAMLSANTATVSSLTFTATGANNLLSGSSFYLYGISNA